MNRRIAYFFLLLSGSLYAQWPSFVDVTNSKGIDDVSTISYLFGNGASIVDFDKDGHLDIFLCTEAGEVDRLYKNDGTGNFTDMADVLGLDSSKRSRVALWFDYDGDEDLDLITLGDCYLENCPEPITISCYEQKADGTFAENSKEIGLDFGAKYRDEDVLLPGGLSAGDLNNDGYLDLLVSIWGAPLTYFQNDTEGGFIDVSETSLLGQEDLFRWQPMIHDFNHDGKPDVYINVDFDSNEMWLNNGDGTFSNIAVVTQCNSSYNEMGLTLGDYDNDGDFDIYATNISREDNGVLRHNILLQNQWSTAGVLSFTEVSNSLQVGASGWDWGTTFFEVNNDGKLDLATTNGWTPGNWGLDLSRLWLNLGDGLFGDVSGTSAFSDLYDATSLMAFDMDRDGDLDLMQTLKENSSTNAGLKLYQNSLSSTANPGNYIVVQPRMNGSNHFAIGAVVKVTFESGTQMRLISAGTSFYGQEPAEAYFGLGQAESVDAIEIIWPDQTISNYKDIEANQVIVLSPNQSLSNAEFNRDRPIKLYPNPVDDVLYIEQQGQPSDLKVYNMLGQLVLNSKLLLGQNTIPFSSFPKAVYKVKISTNDGTSKVFSVLKN